MGSESGYMALLQVTACTVPAPADSACMVPASTSAYTVPAPADSACMVPASTLPAYTATAPTLTACMALVMPALLDTSMDRYMLPQFRSPDCPPLRFAS